MSKYLKRLHDIQTWLRTEPLGISDILKRLEHQEMKVSRRQLNRDFSAIESMLEDEERLTHFFKAGQKYFYIHTKTPFKSERTAIETTEIYHTHFYNQILTDEIQFNLELIQSAIKEQKRLKIKLIKDDETSQNLDVDTENVVVCPVKIIYHRNSYYLACFNSKFKKVEVFGLRQLQKIESGKAFNNFKVLEERVIIELKTRFGVTKNINDKVYNIEIKFTPVLGRFIENHHWHESQNIKSVNGDYILYLKCGINRELMGWLFQWMYNVKIVKPLLLKQLYKKTLQESEMLVKDKTPFVYRNIFTDKFDGKL
ncbi:WYL domain-containing protein [Flavobacteriaceae bacterium 14752]|uniref:WYL domain-containing protein n=1 Tax=Mesohalobacter salilacus TaxID=2491711 RepID=UPI000F635134|nr:WYL domain-containing protein [Flavobacteriaceae bacterium 14752]